MSVNVIGHVTNPVKWYKFENDRNFYSLHTLFNGDTVRMLFCSVLEFPGVVAKRLGIKYDFMRNATDEESEEWLASSDNKKQLEFTTTKSIVQLTDMLSR